MDALDTECPRCRRSPGAGSHQAPLPPGRATGAVTTAVRHRFCDPAAREQRNRVATGIDQWARATMLLGILLFVGALFFGIYLIAAEEDQLQLGITMIITGLSMLFGAFFWHAVISWGAELLKCLGRIEDHLPDQ